jgi:hypothetical protein
MAQAGEFEEACKLYAAKDYKGSRVSFERLVKSGAVTGQRNALSHYYLANIYMTAGQSSQARQEYQACLNAHPDPTTAGYCQSILAKLGGGSSSSSIASSSSATASSGGSSQVGGVSGQDRETELYKRKKVILDKAEREVAEVKTEYKERLDKGIERGDVTHRYIKEDGSVIYDQDPATRAAIQKECDEKVAKIREMAQYQLKFLK